MGSAPSAIPIARSATSLASSLAVARSALAGAALGIPRSAISDFRTIASFALTIGALAITRSTSAALVGAIFAAPFAAVTITLSCSLAIAWRTRFAAVIAFTSAAGWSCFACRVALLFVQSAIAVLVELFEQAGHAAAPTPFSVAVGSFPIGAVLLGAG